MHRHLPAVLLLMVLIALTFGLPLVQGQHEVPDPYAKKIARPSDDWKKTILRMQLPKKVRADLWAAEPLVANIVAFAFDEKGRCYVAETFRLHNGVTDNRGQGPKWLEDDLAARTVADRLALYRKFLGPKIASYEKDEDRVRRVEDTTGAGRADKATVFADGFRNAADGLGSGVLARNGNVYYTCIPNLWLLRDTTGAGRADIKKALHTGYGVHVSFIGHDLHGLKMGPDGKLYFTIGDRGLHVETEGRTLAVPDSGSVLRCEPDGTGLEVVATGLRNPQELAFDEFGNLFTGDNNADGGDSARWVHVVEGGDSGWRIGYQYLPRLGAWNAEKLWHTEPANTASYLLPPLAHIGSGPSGLTYHPGTSLLPERYRSHFFLCDFRGGGAGSGVHTFKVQPKGATFEVTSREQFVWGVLATDCDFGPDGGFYVSDWVNGWGMPNRGRIFRFADPCRALDPAVREVKELLAAGFAQRATADLVKLLDHADMRVRQEAQFALVDKKEAAALRGVAKAGRRLARLHAIWGLGQLGRRDARTLEPVVALAGDADAEVRAQALKVLGDARAAAALPAIQKGLSDSEPRVRFFAAQAAGKLGRPEMLPGVVELLRQNADQDAYLRHAGAMAFASIKDPVSLVKLADDPASAVRLGALLALRRLGRPEVSRFLKDADPKLVPEAARAIYDVPIPAALPQLAALTETGATALPADARQFVLRRAVAALARQGKKSDAAAVARVAGRKDMPEKVREEALTLLLNWEKPSGRDPIVGLWRPLAERPAADVTDALRPVLGGIMTGSDKIRSAGAKLAAKHGIKEIGPVLRDLVADKTQPSSVRVETLKALEALKDSRLEEAAKLALADADPRLRHEGRRVLLRKADANQAVKQLSEVLMRGSVVEQQGALALLAELKAPPADEVLRQQLDRLQKGQARAEIQLDILEAARTRGTPELKTKLEKYEKSRSASDHLSAYRETLAGGDATAGRRIFFEKSEVSCVRCHKVAGVGGDVGPDLSGIAAKYPRDYLLASIVEPNREIAKGYESVILTLTNGQTKIGIVCGEDERETRLKTAEGHTVVVPKSKIDDRQRGPSAMASDLAQKLTRTELRDLIEFLSRLR